VAVTCCRPPRRWCGFRLCADAIGKMLGTGGVRLLIALGGPCVPALKQALDEQPMIASGSPMKISASAPPTIVANICIPDFTFLALGAGGLSSKKIVYGLSFSQRGNSTN
jgi:hypothetical protein